MDRRLRGSPRRSRCCSRRHRPLPRRLPTGQLKAGTRETLLGNELGLVEPAASDAKLAIKPGFDLAGALGDGKLAVCTVASCPAGIYGKEALTKLGVYAAVEPKLAQTEDVRAALLLVARGEAKFGIVYATDARAEPKVKVIDAFPASSHDQGFTVLTP